MAGPEGVVRRWPEANDAAEKEAIIEEWLKSTMAARIAQVSGGRVELNMGTLYPGLMRLEQRGFVRGTWGVTESNRKARFYALTPAGKKQLAAEKREWNRMVTTMQAILNEPS